MIVYKINNDTNFSKICKEIGPEKAGEILMAKKSRLNYFYIKNIKAPAANILKQDALSIGAELVCARGVITGQNSTNALLIANDKQVEILTKKEAIQDFGLKELSKFLKNSFTYPKKPEIMGVTNLNEDSFNPQSRADKNSAIKRIISHIDEGASYIDLGGVSSRPGSSYCGSKEEFARIQSVIEEIYRLNLHEKAKFSLDSFDERCLEFALDHGFKMINDITGDTSLAKLASKYDAEYTLMHMQGEPENMQDDPIYDDLIAQIDQFFSEKIAECEALGCRKIVLDVGIGFGKSASDNLYLIKHLEHFLHFAYPLFVGASRKSVIGKYTGANIEDRLPGSLYLHQKAYENGATIIRTHDVKEHVQMFKMDEVYQNLGVSW
ncbi:MAG: dihydropteroate synthase [Campylobacter sp.]|nr:dihydropteroate synthase [Campylobacter sp.]